MAGRTRKRGHGGQAHENHERWLLTYADMITLLVAFFIMLYAMSIMNQQKFQQLAISVRSSFGGQMTNGASTIVSPGGGIVGKPSILTNNWQKNPSIDQALPKPESADDALQDAQRLDTAFETMRAYIRKHGLQKMMHVERNERGVVVTVMTDQMFFARGQADLRADAYGLLDKIAQVVNTVPNQVRVEGHTDNLPIHTVRFADNWDLSVTRATSVLRYLERRSVASSRLEAAGYADQRPVAANDTEYNRQRNRRVDIVILRRY